MMKNLNRLYRNNPVATGIVTAMVLEVAFYMIEWFIWKYTTLSHGSNWVYYDFGIRMGIGFLGMLALIAFYVGDLQSIFCGNISRKAILFCIPFGICFLLFISELFCAEELTPAYMISFLTIWLTQIGSGFFEEVVCRGVLMSGLLAKYKETVRGRLAIVGVTGLVFGLSHLMNFIFGRDIMTCLLWGLDTMIWGMMVAAIYLMTSNLWLVIGIHIAWDIICKIPNYFMSGVANEALYNAILFLVNYVMYGVFIVCAIVICVRYDRINDIGKEEISIETGN